MTALAAVLLSPLGLLFFGVVVPVLLAADWLNGRRG